MTAPAEKPALLPGEFQEYPKWVFPNGDASKGVMVHDAEQEAALTDEPQASDAPAETPRRKPGRPRKSE